MESKTIKVSKENYLWLLRIAAELQKQSHKPVTFDVVINNLKECKTMKKKKLSDLAGSWKMSDEEAKKMKDNIKKLRWMSTKDLIENDIYRF